MKLPVGITPFITKLVIHPDAKVATARSDSSREGRGNLYDKYILSMQYEASGQGSSSWYQMDAIVQGADEEVLRAAHPVSGKECI